LEGRSILGVGRLSSSIRQPEWQRACAAAGVSEPVGILNRFGRSWDRLGERNPFGAILTGSDGGLREWDVEEFLATGRTDAERFIQDLERMAPAASRRTALDFGCGVGRVTRALAAYFEQVVGVDIAPSMIAEARRLNAGAPKLSFVLNRASHLRQFASGTFDVIYCRLVLQHLRPRFVRRYVPELVRVLAAGGILMFQMPGESDAVDSEDAFCRAPVTGSGLKRYAPAAVVRAYRRVKYRLIVDYGWLERGNPRMHMFAMSTEQVKRLVDGAGGRIVAVRSDRSHGPRGEGFEYWVTREREAPGVR
jgi:SAM-dependent methyltransferase